MKKMIAIQGMSCSSCANRIENAVKDITGVEEASINFATEKLAVTIQDEATLQNIYNSIEELGYTPVKDTHKDVMELTGMSCANCASRIEEAVNAVQGVSEAQVNFATEKLYVNYTDATTKTGIIEAIRSLGYDVRQVDSDEPTETKDPMKSRVSISLLFVIPLLYLSMGHMIGFPLPHFLHNPLVMAFTQLALSIPIAWVNRIYYVKGFKQLLEKHPNMDSLVALGTGAAFIQGIIAIVLIMQGEQVDLYFESGAVILTLITLGKYFEHRAKKQTTQAIQALMDLSPKMATIVTDEGEKVVPIELVQVGDLLVSKVGEQIAVDGVIEKGSAQVDESMLTGESMPVSKTIGDTVIGASLNQNGAIYYRATRVGDDTMLAQIMQFIEEAQGSKAPIAKLADTISRYFVPIVMGIAVWTLVAWLLFGNVGIAWSTFIAVLVIACPCALGLATPTAIMVATGKGAQHGILIKNGEALERAHHIDTVVLDKTGTITEGMPVVSQLLTSMDEKALFHLIGSVENLSTHPLAKAIVDKAKTYDIDFVEVADLTVLDGLGVTARVGSQLVGIGNFALATKLGKVIYNEEAESFARQRQTALFVSVDGQVVALLAIADSIKETSKKAIAELQEQGIEVIMITGDNQQTAEVIAKEVGIERVFAEVFPQDKAGIVATLQEQGKIVAMVGDGINDAPALVQADTGMAIGNGTDVAIESADIVLMHSDLMDVVKALRLSKQTIKMIKENLFFAFIYNVIGIPVAMGLFYLPFNLLLNPMIAGLAMSLSSISVVLNALRLNYKKLGRDKE